MLNALTRNALPFIAIIPPTQTTPSDSDEGMAPMTTQYVPFFSRAGLECAFGGLLFGATVGLVAGGALIMTLAPSAFAG